MRLLGPLLGPLLAALLLAGCTADGTRSNDLTVSQTSDFEHDYRDGATATKDLEFPYRGTLRFTATFLGTGGVVGGTHLCPGDVDVVLEVLAPDGSVREQVGPAIDGLNGTGGCGAPEREVRVDEPGTWRLRFRGQAEMSVRGEVHTTARSSD